MSAGATEYLTILKLGRRQRWFGSGDASRALAEATGKQLHLRTVQRRLMLMREEGLLTFHPLEDPEAKHVMHSFGLNYDNPLIQQLWSSKP